MTDIYSVMAKESGERIDALLAQEIEGLTRSQAVRLIDAGLVTLDGRPVKKNHRTASGDIFVACIPKPCDTELIAENIPIDIVFEDEDLIVVNKARGMVVHPGPGHESATLVNALLHHCGDSLSGIGGEKRPGIVHRIDKDTSGLLVVAKNDWAHRFLSAQLADRSLKRTYEAIVHGEMGEDKGSVNAPIGRHRTDRKRMAVTKCGRSAVTHYEVISRYKAYTHVRFMLETGRTHQIRVHMAHLSHPILGDMVYGPGGNKKTNKGLKGQCLHACALSFVHPRDNLPREFSAELPEYFVDVLSRIHTIIDTP